MVELAETIWADGPSSAPANPPKVKIRAWGKYVETALQGAAAGATIYDSKADMDADTSQAANAMAWVLGDATAANNGVYQFDGTSIWTRLGDLPYSYIQASNAGAGKANAIVAKTSIPIPETDGAALIALPIVVDNTASPVTVAFNGGTALTVKTSSGNDVAAGGLTAGTIVAGYVSGSTFRLLSDQASAAIQAAAEAAQAAAEAAAAGLNLPAILSGDFGKQLSVKETDDGYELIDPGVINANRFCRPDGVAVAVTASIASGSASLAATGASFTPDDVGKLITIPGAGAAGANFGTTIAAVVSATEVTLADNASTALSAVSTTIYYGTDNQDAVTAALFAAAGKEIFFPAGVYMIKNTGNLTVYPGTTVKGVFGRSIFRRNAGGGAAGNIFLNAGFNDDAISDSDIVFDKIATDFTLRAGDTDQLIGVYMRMAERVKVLNCVQWYGGDLSALTATKDTEVSGNVAYEITNSAYDHWNSVGRVIIRGNIVVNETVTSRQLIMVTATDTDPGTGAQSTGSSNDIIITGNIVRGVSGNDGLIVVNHLLDTDTLSNVIIANNSVKGGGPNGIVVRGPVNVVVSGNQVDDTDGIGIYVGSAFSGNTDTYPKNVNVTGNVVTNVGNPTSSAIAIVRSEGGLVAGNVVRGGTYQFGIRLYSEASNYQVSGNTVEPGINGSIRDEGSNNAVSTPSTTDFYYSASVVHDGAAPTGSFATLDLSSVVGVNRAIVYLRVLNNSAAAANYTFRSGQMTTNREDIAGIPAGQSRFIMLTTNQNGVVDWFSGTGAVDTEVRVETFHRLQ